MVSSVQESEKDQAPSVLYLEDIECLAPRQDTPGAPKDMMTRIASELGTCIDGKRLAISVFCDGYVLSPDLSLRILAKLAPGFMAGDLRALVDDAISTAFERAISVFCDGYVLSPDLSLRTLAKLAPGFMAGDLRALVDDAISTAFERDQAPSVLYLEDIECLAPRQDTPGAPKDMMTRIASELGTCIDGKRLAISVFCDGYVLSPDLSLRTLAKLAPGFMAGDLNALVDDAISTAFEKVRKQFLCSATATSSPDLSLRTLAKLAPGFMAGDLKALVDDAISTAFERAISVFCDGYVLSPDLSLRTLAKLAPGFMAGDLRALVDDAISTAFERDQAPSVLYLEDIECLAPRQDTPGAPKDMMTRIASELGTCIDGKRLAISVFCDGYVLSPDLSLRTLAKLAPGFMAGDLRALVDDAISTAFERDQAPSVLYLEDIECLAPRQDTPGAPKDMMTRIASELGTCIDDIECLAPRQDTPGAPKDMMTRIASELGTCIDGKRLAISVFCDGYVLSPDLSLRTLAKLAPGFMAGDLRALVDNAFSPAFERVRK
ncbi:hypothetical protein ACOMHN_026528 [Nucella lapillus]